MLKRFAVIAESILHRRVLHGVHPREATAQRIPGCTPPQRCGLYESDASETGACARHERDASGVRPRLDLPRHQSDAVDTAAGTDEVECDAHPGLQLCHSQHRVPLARVFERARTELLQ